MIKYVVIKEDGRVEFTSMTAAEVYKDTINNAVRIDTVEEVDQQVIDNIEVPMWRLRVVLTMMGMKDSVDAIIDSLPEPQKSVGKIAWEYGNTIFRLSSITLIVQQGLNLTDNQVNDIFTQAQNLTV